MDVRKVLSVLRKRWLSIFIFVLLGLAGAGIATLLSPKVYEASARIYVSFAGERAGGSINGDARITQRLADYALMANAPAVQEPVAAALQIPSAPVVVTNPPGTASLTVTATAQDPVRSAMIANTVAKQLGTEIEALETPAGAPQSLLQVTVVQPATTPAGPISPRPTVNFTVGALLGLLIGIATAFLRNTLDNTLKTNEDVEELTGALPLASIPLDPGTKEHPIVQSGQSSARSEAFRQLRTNLHYVDVDEPPKVIVVTSASPGEGKSTTSCNLALALAVNGPKVLLVEADLRSPRLADYLGIVTDTGLTDVLSGQMTWQDAVVPWGRGLFSVLLEGPRPPNPTELLASAHMTNLLSELRDSFDYVIIDTSPLLLVTDAAEIAANADGAIMVVRYNHATRADAAGVIASLQRVGANVLGTVITFTPSANRGKHKDGYGYGYGYGYGSGYVYDTDPK